jgi:SAM-dependent methyltransferase
MSAIAAQEIVAKNAELWSIRARDWAAAQDRDERADFIEGVRRTGIGSGTSVLDLGCGTGGFSLRAAQAGAPVTGIDVAPGMVEVARERVPSGHFDVGDMQSLPYEDSSFDVIAAFHSLQFAPSPSAVLAEVARVGKPGAKVFIAVWGREGRNQLAAIVHAIFELIPERPPPGAPGPFALTAPGELKAVVDVGSLTATDHGYFEMHYEFPDEATLLQGIRSAGPTILAERVVGVKAVKETILRAAAPYRTAEGGYRVELEWAFVLAEV